MSDNIPFEIQMEIILRIPDTKYLIRCRSVSKAWKSVIDSNKFVKAHTLRHQAHNRHHLLISTLDCKDCKYYSIVDDDDTFPHQKVSVFVPDSVHKLRDNTVTIGTSHGLFCIYDTIREDTAVIWNPCIRKTVEIAVPNVNVFSKQNLCTVVGFGVCPKNLDPKLVKITYVSNLSRLRNVNGSTLVEAVVDGIIYWDAVDRIHVDDGTRNPNLIMSFDLTSEEFTNINLPDPLQLCDLYAHLSLLNLRESLTLLQSKFNGDFNQTEICHVWQMIGHGCTRSFNKLYSVNAPDASIYTTLGFRKNGAPIIEVDNDKQDYYKHEHALAMYEPESKSITNIGIYGLHDTFFVRSIMETLLLFGYEI